MGQVLIRKVDDDVLERLRLQARRSGESLEQYLRSVLAEAARPSKAEAMARLTEIRSMSAGGDLDIPLAIRHGRDDYDEYLRDREKSGSAA